MDESDVDICQASNNTDVLKEETDLEFGSGTHACADQEKDGANDFDQECSTRPISAASAASNVLEDCCFESNSSEVITEDDTNHENNGDCSRQKLQEETKCSSGFHSKNDFTSPVDKYDFDATEPDHDSLKDDLSIDIALKALIDNLGVNPNAAVTDFPRSSSPTIGSDQFLGISDGESSNLSFPDVPQHDPKDFVDRSTSIDGGSVVSHGSAHSVSKSYLSSSVSMGEDIPNSLKDGDYYLIPKFKVQAREFCWPMDKLPLSGDRKFEEGAQWEISEKIGHGASGQCFRGYPIDKKDKGFCVKKMSQYNMEEVKALCLAAKEIYTKNISEGARKIVSLYGATISYNYNDLNVCIFMEYMEGGTVKGAIVEAIKQYKEGLDKIDCVHYFKDVLLALEFIHRKGIVHNDVKADNVLLTASKVGAKLCDFGKASAITGHNPASKDVWSAGCFLLEMLGRKYSKASVSGFLKKSNVLNLLPDDVDQDTKQVLGMCFLSADTRQCTAANVLTSHFFDEKESG